MPPETVIDHHIDGERRSRETDRVISELAERQHGRVARRQLLALGIGKGAIDRRVQRRRLRSAGHPGVYAVGHRVRSQEATWMEAVLAAGPDACLSHRAAAAHWGILRSSRVEVTVPRALRSRKGLRVHEAVLSPDEVTVHDGIPVTTVVRTLFDVASVLNRHGVERAAHEADYLRLYGALSLADLLSRYPGHRGNRTVRAIVQARQSDRNVSREEFMDRFLTLIARSGLSKPEHNVWLTVAGQRFEVDCVWREHKLMVELDGWAAHGTKQAYERDRARDRLLTREGWRVIRITWDQLRDEPHAIAADLERLLRR